MLYIFLGHQTFDGKLGSILFVYVLKHPQPLLSSSPILVINLYCQVVDGHISFFFTDKKNALKVFNSLPTLT
jgi:hypothetical protein